MRPNIFTATSGYRNDGDAWLMLVGARYYDAQVGRFITRDTGLSQKPYLYCDADPINNLDPSGHEDKNWPYRFGRLLRRLRDAVDEFWNGQAPPREGPIKKEPLPPPEDETPPPFDYWEDPPPLGEFIPICDPTPSVKLAHWLLHKFGVE